MANPPDPPAGLGLAATRSLYTGVPTSVKRCVTPRPAPPLLMGCVMFMAAGCAAAPGPNRQPFVAAVRYDVIPAWVSVESVAPLEVSRDDFTTIAKWGFDAAVLYHVADEDRIALLSLAHDCGLRLAVPDGTIDDFVATGLWPAGASPTARALSARLRPVASHPAFAAVLLGGARSEEACARLRQVRALLDARDLPVVATATECGSHTSTPLWVNTGELWDGPAGEASQRLLSQYLAALREGRTGPLIVDRFGRLPRDPSSTFSSDPTACHRAALVELITRAKRWGPLLAGAAAEDVRWPDDAATGLGITLFQRGERRYLLVCNITARFVRRELNLPLATLGAPLSRAVEVPPASEQTPGSVWHVRARELAIPVTVRPADAALFELF